MAETQFNQQLFTPDTQSRVLKRVANSVDGLAESGAAEAVGVAKPVAVSHQSFLVRPDSPDFNGTTTRPRSGPGSDYGNRVGGGAPVDDTSSEKDHVDNKGSGQHLDRKSFTAKRAGVDGKPAGVADADKSDFPNRGDKMPNPAPTRYKMLYEQDDQGNYRSDGGSPHFRSLHRKSDAYAETGKRPPLSDDDPCSTALNDAALACDSAGATTENYEAREAFLNEALEHIDRACKAHRDMKRAGRKE